MRIRILSQHFPPEPITRLRDLTQYLVARGHDISVVTSYPSYPIGRVYDGYRLRLYNHQVELGASVTRVFAVPYRGLAITKRMVSYFSFAFSALILGLLPARRPDVIYAYHPPLTTGLAAAVYSMVARVPFVYDVQDLWPDAIVAAGFLSEGSLTFRLIRATEKFAYRRAAHITVISEGMRHNLVRKGVPTKKISVISNWGDPDVFTPSDGTDVRQRYGWEESFVVMIAGNLGLTHGLETVIKVASLVQDESHIIFVFLGSGAAKQALMTEAESQHLTNVVFLDQVVPTEAARLINAADVMLVHLKPALEGEFSVPHRVFSYMLCGKPIIAAATGSTAELVQSFECGWACPPSDPATLSSLVRQLASKPAVCRERGLRGLSVSQGNFSRDWLLRRIEQTILTCQSR